MASEGSVLCTAATAVRATTIQSAQAQVYPAAAEAAAGRRGQNGFTCASLHGRLCMQNAHRSRPSLIAHHSSLVARRPSLVARCPSLVAHRSLLVARRPRSLPVAFHPSPVARRPSPIARRPSLAARRSSLVARCSSLVTRRQQQPRSDERQRERWRH